MSLEQNPTSGDQWEITGFKGYKKLDSGKYVAELEGPGGEIIDKSQESLIGEVNTLKKDFESDVWSATDKEALQLKVKEMESILDDWPNN